MLSEEYKMDTVTAMEYDKILTALAVYLPPYPKKARALMQVSRSASRDYGPV